MFRGNEKSDPTRIAGIGVPVKTLAPEDKLRDWEMGGVALNDPSQGLEYQLWKYTLVIDPLTDHGQVFVQAPSVLPTLLFEGDFISEIAGAFDQNMNPMVAYQQSGDAKIWWWDPTIPGMVHTTLPPGCIDLRVTLDDKRQFNVADSDIILSYVRDGSLYFRLQRERYATEHLLEEGVLRLVYSAMNTQWRLQWKALGSGEGFTDPMLGDIVYDLCRRAGIPPENIDVSELYNPLTDFVPGLLVDSDDGLDTPLSWLMDVYGFYKVERNKKICFPKRGGPVVAEIPYNDLVDDFPKTLKRVERDKNKLPKVVNLTHIDPDGGFAKNKQSAGRRSNVFTGTSEKSITTKVVLKADQASRAAWFKIKAEHGEAVDYEFSTRLKYTYLIPGDVIRVQDVDGSWYRMHITDRNEDDGTIKFTAEHDGGEAVYHGLYPQGRPLDPPVSTTPGTIGATELDIFNIPVNRDTEDELTLHLGARGAGSGWQGYTLYFSPDGVLPYQEIRTIEVAANIGETVTAVTDSSTSVEVLMPEPLQSAAPGELAAGRNRAVLGDEEVQYESATLLGMVDGKYHYLLSLARGVLHTTREAWGAGIRFAEFDDAIVALKIDRTYYGSTLFYKAVSLGTTIDEAVPLSYDFDFAWSQYEFPVTNVVVTAAEGGGVTVTWDGSPRIGTFGPAPYHSKYMTGYRVKFADGHTIDTTAETVTYAGGLMGSVVEVRALNAITGEGPLADGQGAVDPGDISVFGFSGSFPDMYEGQSVFMWNGDNGISMSGGLHEAYARGFVVPGVGAKAPGWGAKLDATTFCGIPFAAGTYTSLVRLMAASPDPLGTGMSDVNQSVTVLPRPSHGLLDLEFREYQMHKTTLINTTPPWKKFQINGGGASLWFYGVTTGKVAGQFKINGAAALSVVLGINNMHGKLFLGGPTNAGVGEFADCAVLVGDGTYSMELNADTGDWWLYRQGTGLVSSGNVPRTGDHQYRICMSNPNDQIFDIEFNGGNEAWFMPITQAGHGGIPVPSRDIPIAWAYCEPDYILSFNGSGELGAIHADAYAGGPSSLVKANVAYTTGRHRFKVQGAYSAGICAPSFDLSDGVLGSPGSPNSAGVDNGTLRWSWGGGGSATLTPIDGNYTTPILALDADSNTLKVVFEQTYGDPVVVYTLPIPSGETWHVGAWVTVGTIINGKLPGPVGYADAIVP